MFEATQGDPGVAICGIVLMFMLSLAMIAYAYGQDGR